MNPGGYLKRTLEIDYRGSRVFRRQRFKICLTLIDKVLEQRSNCRIIDIGGSPYYWDNLVNLIGTRPLHITLLNRDTFPINQKYSSVVGDARCVEMYDDMSFDLVHSNSVIEHVGNWEDMAAMAREVRRLAPMYFLQTPYFWFPIEPHCSTLFFHWMPVPIRISMLMRRPRGTWGQATDVTSAMRQIQSASLLDQRMLSTLFPDATIKAERFLGFTKSLMAVKTADGASSCGKAADKTILA